MKVYYAHCKAIYGTPQERRDVELLEQLGFVVINPGENWHDVECKKYKDKMYYFLDLVEGSDLLAFRSLPSGDIPVGVSKEIDHAIENGISVIELPSLALRKRMSVDETRVYLAETGQR